MNEVYNRRREVQEAIFAGERARASLQEADRQFASAGNWGLIDIFGGNTVSGLMKHMKINNASRCVEEARRDLDAFRSELGILAASSPLRISFSTDLSQISLCSPESAREGGRSRRQSEGWMTSCGS